MRVALLHNRRPAEAAPALPDDTFEEYDSDETIADISNALRQIGMDVEPVLADRQLPERLEEGRYNFAFNIAEGEGRRCREAIPAAVCELLGIPFTGSDALTLAVTLDKAMAKRVVSPDVPVARGVLVDTPADEADLSTLRYPAIVKPNDEGSSKGIRDSPIVDDPGAAAARCRWLQTRYGCPVLVEEYLPGAEVTVGIAGNGPDVRVLGIMEISPVSDERNFVYSIEVKRDWQRRVRYDVPPRLPEAAIDSLRGYALRAWRLLGCRDIARIDFRLDGDGVPRFIECNPLPGLNKETGDIVVLSRKSLPYEKLVQGILTDAMQRAGVAVP